MLNTILQMPANFIFCFRAKEKMKPVPGGQPKELGFMPIAGEELIFEMTATCLLPPKADGVPCWNTEYSGEKLMMKLPEQFRSLLSDDKPLDESKGRVLAEWAKGAPAPSPSASSREELERQGWAAAKQGSDSLARFWQGLSVADKKAFTAIKDNDWKPSAAQADAASGGRP